MAKLTYTNERGQSLTFGDSAPLLVTKIDGLGSPANEIQIQKSPYQDGSSYLGSTLVERNITIEGVILAQDREPYRRQLLKTFNSKLRGTLIFERGSAQKEIDCIVETVAFPSAMQENFQPFFISLLCPSPFWLDPYIESEELAAWIGGFSFVLTLPTKFSEAGQERTVRNDGDVETPVRIEFFGPATNPKISNLTVGEFIRIKRDLKSREKLVITTEFGNKSVILVDVDGRESNAFHYIDLESVFWGLVPGENVLRYDADAGVEQAKVLVTWRNRFLGV